jgi:hypothetical protein
VLTDYALGGRLPHKYERRLRRGFRPVPGNTSWPELVTAETLARVPAAARPGTTVPAGAVSTTYSLADSLDAVLGLFVAKRFAGQLPSLGLVPLGGLLAGSSNADGEYNYTTGRFEESKPSAGAVAAGLTMALGSVVYMYIHNAPYSMAKFDALRVACEAGAPIPAGLRAQIKPQHFDQGREMRNRLARKAARKNR